MPDHRALVAPDGVLRYGELDRIVTAAAQFLREKGCTDGARVAFYGAPDRRQVILLYAALRAGGVACPISTRVPAREIPSLLRRVGARILVTEEDLPALRGEVAVYHPASAAPAGRGTLPMAAFEPDRAATIVFTSGSTGRPAAALHSFGNHYYSALGSNENIHLGPEDGWLLSLPLYHVGGLAIIFRCLTARAAVVLPAPEADLRQMLSSGPVSHVSMVTTQLWRLLRDENEPPAGMRAVLLGGSALPPELTAEALRRGFPVATSYGLTEMGSQVTATPPGAGGGMLATAGRLLPHRELKIAADGEILVRGRTLFLGYVDGDTVLRPVDAEGWYHTRDLGHLDDEGLLHVVGRIDHLFISGGENVQPEEIEAALHAVPGVRQAVVVPVSDPEFGQRPVAFLHRQHERGIGADEMRSQLAASLPRFKIPIAFYELPEEAEGMKMDRRALRRRAEVLWSGGSERGPA